MILPILNFSDYKIWFIYVLYADTDTVSLHFKKETGSFLRSRSDGTINRDDFLGIKGKGEKILI
ncbi:hypothetical protein A1D22_08635 [Pasteurellaceae bacterium LFhippo2]|nr:hypothetical protein [Pasteurellaceae bacterium LFhippo2]